MKLFWSLAMRIVEIKQIFGIIQAVMLGGNLERRNCLLLYKMLISMLAEEGSLTKAA